VWYNARESNEQGFPPQKAVLCLQKECLLDGKGGREPAASDFAEQNLKCARRGRAGQGGSPAEESRAGR
jgi:hypothetical protein